MRKAVLLLCLALLATLAVPALVADESSSETLNGEYIWKRQDKDITGPIKAVFEATGESSWNVSFHFTFENEEHLYSGTAEGSLTDGELKGEVMSDGDEPRPFEFHGSFVDGSFTGKHAVLRDGEASPTGTITLSR